MAASNLDRVIEELKTLTPDEQRKLRELLDDLLVSPAPQMSEAEFEQHLLAKGIIGEIPPPITDSTPFQNRRLMDVQGKPLSETVLEERR
jgi:hypothetical protein